MKYVFTIVLILSFGGCATQEEEAPKSFPWINSEGNLATKAEVSSIKKQCEKRLEEAKANKNINKSQFLVRKREELALECAADLGYTVKEE